MSTLYNPTTILSGMVLSLDAANPKSKLGPNLIVNPTLAATYTANQNVTITQNGIYVQVVTNQTTSSPGAYPIGGAITCTPNTQYTFRVKGFVSYGSGLNLYATGNVAGQLAYTGSITTTNQWTEITFTTGASDTQLRVGILWSGPIMSSTVQVEYAGVYQVSAFYDISGNSNTATMFGTAPFSSDGGGCFDFATVTGINASNASMGFSFASNMIPTTGSFTFNCWVKNPPTNVGQCGMFSNSGSGDGYRFGVGLDGIYYLIGPSYNESAVSFLSTLNATLWYNVVAVFDRSGTFNSGTPQMRMYCNGILQGTGVMYATQTASANVPPGLVKSACCALYTGKVATFSAYNRALSAAEILQNFTALRGRFGV